MPPKVIPTAVRRELDARFQELNGILEQRMQRLEALIAPAQAAPDTAEAAPAANFVPAPEEPALGGQPQEPVQETPQVVIPGRQKSENLCMNILGTRSHPFSTVHLTR